jgi:biotin carboxyl carrier protein
MAVIRAPITGSVWRVLVAPGDRVAAGDEIAIIESMKLEIPVEAEAGGTVRRVLVGHGDRIAEGQPMIELG